jgi:hypothetical protein
VFYSHHAIWSIEMNKFLVSSSFGLIMIVTVAGCTNTYDPGQRAAGGALIGAGSGAALGAIAGGGGGALVGAVAGGAVGATAGYATTPEQQR